MQALLSGIRPGVHPMRPSCNLVPPICDTSQHHHTRSAASDALSVSSNVGRVGAYAERDLQRARVIEPLRVLTGSEQHCGQSFESFRARAFRDPSRREGLDPVKNLTEVCFLANDCDLGTLNSDQ